MVSIKKIIKDKKILNIIGVSTYLLLFFCVSIYVGLKHEHWADEAQSWLIARDCSFFEIINIIRYEGTPALWHFILKICIICGLKYNELIFLTTTITCLGIIFLFKNKNIPLLLKIFLPYTYFIFFQYTIVARSYTLLFPLLMYISYIYPEKEKKIVRYFISIVLLMNVSLHGFLISGGLWFQILYDVINKVNKKEKIEHKISLFLVITSIFLFGVVLYVFPKRDCAYVPGNRFNFIYILSNSMVDSTNNHTTNIIGTALFLLSVLAIFIDKKDIIKNIVLILPNFLWICIIGCSGGWHIGILFLLLLFVLVINNLIKENKFIFILLIITTIIQIGWNINCIVNDFYNDYSVGEKVKEYLIKNDYEKKQIIGVDFWSVQVNPYFENNIFSNYSNSFINWKTKEYKKIMAKNLVKSDELYDIYIIPLYEYYCYKSGNDYEMYSNENTYYEKVLIKKLLNSKEYTYEYFDGDMYYKDKKAERTGLLVFIKNEI